MREQPVHRALDHRQHVVEPLVAAVVRVGEVGRPARSTATRFERSQQHHPLALRPRRQHMALVRAVHAHIEVVRPSAAEVARPQLPSRSLDGVARTRQHAHRTRVGRIPFMKAVRARRVDGELPKEPSARSPGPEDALRSRASANIPRADKDHAVQSRL